MRRRRWSTRSTLLAVPSRCRAVGLLLSELGLLPAAKKQCVLPDAGLYLNSVWLGIPAGTMVLSGMIVFK